MATITQETRFELAQRELVCISHARGQTMTCDSGELWITVDGDPLDIILRKGETWFVTSNTEVVISAIKASTLHVRQHLSRGSLASGARHMLRSLRNREFPSLAAFSALQIQ